MGNISQPDDSTINIGEDTFPCPKCGKPQSYFIDRGHGWCRCPPPPDGCDTGIQKREIPDEYKHLILPMPSYKSPDEREKEVKKKERVETRTVKPPPDPSESLIQVDARQGELFDRPMEDWEVLEQILEQFGIPDGTRTFMVKRAQRQGTMHPQEVQRILHDMKSGMPKKQISYVAEEYYLALEAENEKRRQDSYPGSYPMYRSEYEGSSSFPWRRGTRSSEDGFVPKWERGRGDSLTPADFERMWNERIDKQRREQEIRDLNKTIQNMGGTIMQLEHRMQNPPKTDETEKFYKMFIEQERKSTEQMMLLVKELQAQRDTHNKELVELYKAQASRSSTEGYKQDNVRLVADAINAATGVVQTNKPLQTAVKTIAQSQVSPKQSEPVDATPEIDGDIGILSLVNPKFKKKR